MTKLHNIEIAEEVLEILQQFVMAAGDDDVLAYAEFGNKNLLKGLRPTKENAPRIKERLVRRLGSAKKISQEDAGFLDRHNPFSFFDGLELSVIELNLDNLCASLGKDKVTAVLLLSSRPELRKLAEQIISGEHVVKEISSKECENFAHRTFQSYLPFMLELRDIFSDDSDDNSPSQSESQVDAENEPHSDQEYTHLKEKLEQLKKDFKAVKKDAGRSKDLEKKLDRSEKKRAEQGETVKTLRKDLSETRNELEMTRAAIISQVNEELESVLHSWLRGPFTVEGALSATVADDLLERAGLLVEKQQEIDRHAGNRALLAQRLRAASDVRLQVAALSRESLRPLPELAGILVELDGEISRLRQQLDKESEPSVFVQNFMTKISQAKSPDDVVACKNLIESIKEAGVLERAETRALFEYCDKRMDLAYDQYVPEIRKAKPIVDPFRRLKNAVLKDHEIIWFLDGHNILFYLTEMFGMFGTDGKPTEAARYRLSDALVSLVADAGRCQIRLYYDGPDRSEYSPAPNVKVIYSGGQGEHRADNAICSDMEYLCSKAPSVPFFITTDDRGLRAQASNLSAYPLCVDDLYVLMRNSGLI